MAESPQAVAYQLFRSIAFAEGKWLGDDLSYVGSPADREWILQTYSDCLYAVQNPNLKQGLV